MKINGIGCSLVDNLYSPVDFSSPGYRKWLARSAEDIGLVTGGLVFGDDLEESSGRAYPEILKEITGGNLVPDKNIGGPSIVALIHMAQLLGRGEFSLGFYGSRGDDENGEFILSRLKDFSIDTGGYITVDEMTPFTDVLSDPSYNNNDGERTFINYIGAAGVMTGDSLPGSFYDADMLLFGGTGLTPGIHDDLSDLLKNGKDGGSITCVNTVYDFRNQKLNPGKPWPLVRTEADFSLIDILIADNEEALKISGRKNKQEAAEFFSSRGVKSVVITHGSEDIICSSDGSFFEEKGIFFMPVCAEAGELMRRAPAESADTTGCGDNFAGGLYASTASQLKKYPGGKPSLRKAVALGIVSGGFAGLYRGGVFYEAYPGEKAERLKPLIEAYQKQTGENHE